MRTVNPEPDFKVKGVSSSPLRARMQRGPALGGASAYAFDSGGKILNLRPSDSRVGCEDIVADIIDRAPGAIDAARDETAGLSDSIVSAVQNQLAQLRSNECRAEQRLHSPRSAHEGH